MPFDKWEICGFLACPLVALFAIIAADYGWPYIFDLWLP
jgi:hypothetical protein